MIQEILFSPTGLMLLGGLLLLVVLRVLLLLIRRAPKYPYRPREVMTASEAAFFAVLRGCVPRGALLLSKVRLADYLEVTTRQDFMAHFGRISQKHTDFLLVAEEDMRPLLAIELDDSSHRRNQRTINNDYFKDRAHRAAGLPLLRVPTARSYDARALRAAILEMLR